MLLGKINGVARVTEIIRFMRIGRPISEIAEVQLRSRVL